MFDKVAIYNALKHHRAAITVWVDGIAASIASMIAMAGDEVVMPETPCSCCATSIQGATFGDDDIAEKGSLDPEPLRRGLSPQANG